MASSTVQRRAYPVDVRTGQETRSHATPCITSMLIDYDVERGNERVLLELGRPSDSEWQPTPVL